MHHRAKAGRHNRHARKVATSSNAGHSNPRSLALRVLMHLSSHASKGKVASHRATGHSSRKGNRVRASLENRANHGHRHHANPEQSSSLSKADNRSSHGRNSLNANQDRSSLVATGLRVHARRATGHHGRMHQQHRIPQMSNPPGIAA